MKFLHTMLRVGDLQRSIDFYTTHFGMTLRRTTDRPEQQYTLAFLGYGGDERETDVGEAEIELTYNYGVSAYDVGTAFGHLALGVPDVGVGAFQAELARFHEGALALPTPEARQG